jgi:hypothetical protein
MVLPALLPRIQKAGNMTGHHLSANWAYRYIEAAVFKVNLRGGAFGGGWHYTGAMDDAGAPQKPGRYHRDMATQPCRDLGGILGAPPFECQLPHGHSGVHKSNGICWDRT